MGTRGSLGAAAAASSERKREGLRRPASLMVSAAAVAAPLRGGRWVIVGGAREDDQRQIPIGKEGEPGGGREGGFDIPKSALHAAPAHRQHDARPREKGGRRVAFPFLNDPSNTNFSKV